ncbi:phosphotransferase [Microbispora sp. ATCC PTA-5024]|uniref:phosphotransferase n=1 Tax=Microbispora sp. ATCC PTA-5024 TaxID=316330 RepID=UPI0003DDA6DD|nr:phosphotransferase [Microbispora sp. ATCC PTA-5024]ETK36191.1 phosphotransferase [Microbispora sp. ATCC PTA-5024]
MDLAEAELTAALAEHWGIEPHSAEYLPVGAGSYHWSVADRRGAAWFVKVDDLGAEDAGRDDAFDRLDRSFGAALALRRDAGLDFVLAPIPTATDAAVRRLTSRYALSVFPMVTGAAGHFGAHRPEDLVEVVDVLAELHGATPMVADIASRADLVLPGRDTLEEALQDLDREWTGGPYAEPARKLLSGHAGHVQRSLADFDRRVDQVRDTAAAWVVTHGEPHPGNVMRTPAGLRLIDWGTVQIAPPERDLWMLTPALARMLGEDPVGDADDVLDRYSRATGRTVSPAGLGLYPLWWRLADIAIFVDELRRPHGTGEDIAASLTYLTGYLETSRD